MINCPQCNTANEIGQENCISCGSPLPGADEVVCPNCQALNPAYFPNCLECGSDLFENEALVTSSWEQERSRDESEEQPISADEEEPFSSVEVDWLKELKHVTGPLESEDLSDTEMDGEQAWEQDIADLQEIEDPSLAQSLIGVEPIEDSAQEPEESSEESSPDLASESALELVEKTDGVAEEEGVYDEAPDVADDFANQEAPVRTTSELPQTMPLGSYHELEGLPEQLAKEDLPDWIDEAEQSPREPIVSKGADDYEEAPSLEELMAVVVAAEQEESHILDETLAPTSESEETLIMELPSDAPDWLAEIMDEPSEITESPEAEHIDAEISPSESSVAELEQDLASKEADQESSDTDRLQDSAPVVLASQLVDQEQETSEKTRESAKQPVAVSDSVSMDEDIAPPVTNADELLAMLDDLSEDEDELEEQVSELEPGNSLTSEEIPDWLQAIQPKDLVGSGFIQTNMTVQVDGPLAGLTGVIPISAALAISKSRAGEFRYEMTKEQQQQVVLLEQLTKGERIEKVEEKAGFVTLSSLQFRLILGLLLIAAILAGLFLPPVEQYVPGSANIYIPEGVIEAFDATDALAGRPALVAFEYTPAMAGEMDIVARVYLQHLSELNSPVLTVSQVAAGVPMAERMVQQANIKEHVSLGLLPGEAIGVRYLGTCIEEPTECNVITSHKTDSDVTEMLANVGLIIVLTADRDSLISWIEQTGSHSDVPIVSGVSQAMGPIAAPFLASGQIVGNLDGLPGAAAYEGQLTNSGGEAGDLLATSVLAQWVIILALASASIFFGIQAAQKRARR